VLFHQVSSVFGIDFRQFLFTLDIRAVKLLHTAAAQIPAAAAPVAGITAGRKSAPHDFLALSAGGVFNEDRLHTPPPFLFLLQNSKQQYALFV
jgi:hypothetical protein